VELSYTCPHADEFRAVGARVFHLAPRFISSDGRPTPQRDATVTLSMPPLFNFRLVEIYRAGSSNISNAGTAACRWAPARRSLTSGREMQPAKLRLTTVLPPRHLHDIRYRASMAHDQRIPTHLPEFDPNMFAYIARLNSGRPAPPGTLSVCIHPIPLLCSKHLNTTCLSLYKYFGHLL